jgi:hypothetical protein
MLLILGSIVAVAGASLASSLPEKTVMAWLIGNATECHEWILNGAAKGAINAVSRPGLFSLAANKTDAWFRPNPGEIAHHRSLWQEGAAKAAGIRTFPMIGMGSITDFRLLVQPHVQATAIAGLAADALAADIDGINIDFEPPDAKNPDGSLDPSSPLQATIQDGIAFAAFLDALAAALHALPGKRRTLSMDGGSVAGACWSVGPMDHGKRNHTWDELPCPWITNIWQLGALAASRLDMMIPMDSYTANSSEYPYITWIYQKYFPIDREFRVS